ncbi:MAG: glutamyl-tRNA reductase [Candidatus Binatia bacterium]
MSRDLVIVGVSHRTAPVEVREKLAMANGDASQLLPILLNPSEVSEAVVLSTCNRVEVVACCREGDRAVAALRRRLFAAGGLDETMFGETAFELRGREAVRHVFRVASSLDSMVVGEPQILGQMKRQFGVCSEVDAVGPVLSRVFHKSFSVAKRVRSETGIAARAVSVASVAADLAAKIFETLTDRTVLLLGAGEIGEAAATHFVEAGATSVMVANRTFEKAVELARGFDGTPIPLDRLGMYLPLADMVVGSAGGGQLIDAAAVRAAMRERKHRPVFFIDLAVPRNFDKAINDVDAAYLYGIDDLTAVAEENLGERKREAVRGEAIVEREVDKFWQWFEKLDVAPTVTELREYAESVRVAEIEKTLGKLGPMAEPDRERIEQMTRAIINKLLHNPTTALRQDRPAEEELALISAARELFGLGRKKS